jgi:type IV secretory pathway VirB2 component (pilin)
MSRWVWNVLGGCTVLAGILLLQMVRERSAQLPPNQRDGQILALGVSEAVLAAIAFACFFPKTHPVTLRIIAVIGIAACGFNLLQGFRQGDFSHYPMNLFWLFLSLILLWRGDLGNALSGKK